MPNTQWIFLSPHFDDAALSVGGLIWTLCQQNQTVDIWTIMAGFPESSAFSSFAAQNHAAWGKSGEEAIRMRREEDIAACRRLGADHQHYHWPDAIYRRDQDNQPIIKDDHDLFHQPPEHETVQAITSLLENAVPQNANLIIPLGLGSHIDHLAVHRAAIHHKNLTAFYADYPYILNAYHDPRITSGELIKIPHALPPKALQAWQEAVLCYQSQLSGFWRDKVEARLALQNYQTGGGGRLWQKRSKPLSRITPSGLSPSKNNSKG